MTHVAVLHLICVFGVFQADQLEHQTLLWDKYSDCEISKGVTALIQTQRTVMAAEGEEVTLNCQLVESKEVVQVMWQKLLPEREKNLASYHRHFGPKVNPDFRDKVEFKDAGLQNSSIVIKNVTEQDEGCYRCLFNTYPEGALTGSTCLQLYELHEPVLHVGGSNSSEEAVVSCSATGRPAPTVTLSLLQRDLQLSNYSSVTVTNANGTVTVTTTAVLSGLRGNDTQVGCAVRVLSGPQIEVFMMIPEVKPSPADDFNKEPGSDNTGRNRILIVVSAVGACVVMGVFFLVQHKNQNSSSHGDLKMNERSQSSIKDSDETEGASVTEENSQIRHRPSPENKQEDPNLSPSTSKPPKRPDWMNTVLCANM